MKNGDIFYTVIQDFVYKVEVIEFRNYSYFDSVKIKLLETYDNNLYNVNSIIEVPSLLNKFKTKEAAIQFTLRNMEIDKSCIEKEMNKLYSELNILKNKQSHIEKVIELYNKK